VFVALWQMSRHRRLMKPERAIQQAERLLRG